MSTQQQQEECDRCGREDVLECQSSKCIDHDEEVEEVNCEWWGCKFSSNRGNIMTFFNATEKWVEENAEDVYDEYGRLDNFIDGREEAEEEDLCCSETGEIDEETGFKVMDCDLCGEGLIEE